MKKKAHRNYKAELAVALNSLANAESAINKYDYDKREAEKRIVELEARLTEARRHLLPFGDGNKAINFLPLAVVECNIEHKPITVRGWGGEEINMRGSSRARLVVIADVSEGIEITNVVKIGGKQ